MSEPPVNLLSLDGGGIRGVSELTILDEIMRRVQQKQGLQELPKPCDYFHLIGGTSTGGLIAVMLGRLRMTTEVALNHYNNISGHIFSGGNKKWKIQDGTFKASTLKKEMIKTVAEIEGYTGNERMLDSSPGTETGKAFVCALATGNMRYPRRFRTYPVLQNQSADCEIWEAARATTAAPTIFKGIEIAGIGGIKERFVDAGIKFNNPTKEVREEARQIFGENRHVGVLISIGTGHPDTIGLPKPDQFQRMLPLQLIDTLKNIATDCESVADDLLSQYINLPGVYYRFNVTHGAGQVSLEEWKKVGDVVAHTRAYLQDPLVSQSVNSVVQILCDPSSRSQEVTLATLCTS